MVYIKCGWLSFGCFIVDHLLPDMQLLQKPMKIFDINQTIKKYIVLNWDFCVVFNMTASRLCQNTQHKRKMIKWNIQVQFRSKYEPFKRPKNINNSHIWKSDCGAASGKRHPLIHKDYTYMHWRLCDLSTFLGQGYQRRLWDLFVLESLRPSRVHNGLNGSCWTLLEVVCLRFWY